MAVNLSSLAPVTTAALALSNLVLVSPQSVVGYQPQNAPGSQAQRPPLLLFNYEGENAVALESDITDHYVEDNRAVQDQIAIRPETVTVQGFIGELNDIPPPALAILKALAQKLTVIGAYAPKVDATAQLAYAEAFFLYQTAATVIDPAVSAWSSLSTGVNVDQSGNLVAASGGNSIIADGKIRPALHQNKQQLMFQQFYGYWSTRRLFTVQTPWAVFQNMAIKSLRAVQDAETRVTTTFEVTFKTIRTAQSRTFTQQEVLDGRANEQAADLQNNGIVSPTPDVPLVDKLTTFNLF